MSLEACLPYLVFNTLCLCDISQRIHLIPSRSWVQTTVGFRECENPDFFRLSILSWAGDGPDFSSLSPEKWKRKRPAPIFNEKEIRLKLFWQLSSLHEFFNITSKEDAVK